MALLRMIMKLSGGFAPANSPLARKVAPAAKLVEPAEVPPPLSTWKWKLKRIKIGKMSFFEAKENYKKCFFLYTTIGP
jgi:hypothetical protein